MTTPTPAAQQHPSPQTPRRNWRRWLPRAAVLLLALLIGAELFARFYLGLGDPPLSMFDPQTEYRLKPGDYHRFGNHIFVNEYSMRSGPITPTKTDPSELRVLVLGDSVINGGSQTDNSQLATAILQSRLHDALRRPVYVGNISAGSWGPPNELAYLQKFGLFDADCLVLIISSHDYADAPDFKPVVDVHPSFPGHRPLLALQEGVTRYLIPRITHAHEAPDPGTVVAKTPGKEDVDACLDATRQMVRLAHDHGIPILVAQHLEVGELDPGSPEHPGHIALGAAVRDEHEEPFQLGPAFRQSRDAGQNPYRDDIHPNPRGQQVMADALYPQVLRLLQERLNKPATAAATTQPTH